MVPATTSLTGFSRETIWPLGQLRLLVTIGDADHSTRAWMNFMIVRSLSPYNGIIGRPGIREIQAVPSTAHGMLKFPVDGGIMIIRSTILIPTECAAVAIGGTLSAKGRTELCSLLKKNLDIFAWKPSYMTGVPRSIAEHRLNIREGYSPVRQKKRGQASERAKAIQIEVQKLVGLGIVREVYYHEWLSNLVMVKKHDGSWRMYVDFTDLNKACPQDCYPLLKIDWKVESLYGYPFKCFLDAYKGYHQIQMAESDEEKMAFHTSQGEDCYTKMPFGLKNVGATYQRLVDKAFDSQPRKDKSCPNKTEVVLQLSSPRTIKEAQSLNGKLASLNRFLSKLTEKSLPLFKTLKKCIKKSEFHWTPKAEQAFKQLKQHLSELPLLVAPKPKEELIVYLSATHGAISAVLMTERGTVQTSIYFISRALQSPELNYTPMEKLVLSLVFAAKRLRSLGEGIKARLGEGNNNWIEELPHVLWAHRTMIMSSHDDTPFSLTYGTEAVIPVEIGMPTYRTTVVDAIQNDEELQLNLDLLEERRERAAIREAKAKLKMKYYNARVRDITLRPREFVYRSNDASHAANGGKLGPNWEGPFEVTKALGDGAYKLRSTDGKILLTTWNIANLKKCYL
ncbi:reverse transcriptase domain-containing protein [Tanacetum coccineum]